MEIYEPREDSFFLQNIVRHRVKGRVLDMGTGSGIQAKTALESKSVTEVVAADINPFAAEHAGSVAKFVLTDLFENIRGKFDTIIFNPPYLPDEPKAPDVALDGGPTGIELTLRFVEQAKEYLAENGLILLLASSLADIKTLEKKMKELGFKFGISGELKMNFEILYCYELRLD